MAVECPKCHTNNPDTLKFCGECGTRLDLHESPQTSITKTLETSANELTRGALFAGRYEIIEELGTGGMGKVFRAFDRKIKEEVAIKFLKPEIAADKKAVERFSSEIRTTRKISHRNVCRMHDLNEEGKALYITMEYVRGEDLKSVIRRMGILTTGKAVSIARQVAEGMAEAHKVGIVHRDLKPRNLMIDQEGNAKIMDFGIARSLADAGITREGAIIGTPEYMSPEQIDGQEADERADLYALGIILYEMVTGTVPFEGGTAFAVGLKHKSEAPENPRKLNPQIPADLSRLILRCLEKDREKRFQTAAELLVELERVEHGLPTSERMVFPQKPLSSRVSAVKLGRRRLLTPAIAVAVVVLGAVVVVLLSNKQSSKQPILPSHRQMTFTGEAAFPALSPDGKFIAYVTGRGETGFRGLVQDLTGNTSIDVFDGAGCLDLHWTPDGSDITVVREDGVFLMPRLGGSPRKLEYFLFMAWSPDGAQYAGAKRSSNVIVLVNKLTGKSTSFFLTGPILFILGLDWSPAGDRLLVLTLNKGNKYCLWTVKTDGRQQNLVLEDDAFLSSPRWGSTGDAVIYLRGRASRDLTTELWKLPISRETGKAARTPSLLFSGISMGGLFTLSADDRQLLYTRESQFSNLWLARVEPSAKDRTVKAQPLSSGTSVHEDVSISPDRKRIAFSRGDGKTMNIYVMPIEGGDPVQLTFFDSRNRSPAWSPDGTEIAFGSSEGGKSRVWKISAQGGTPYQFANSELSETLHVLWQPRSNILYHKTGNRNFQILNPKTGEETPLVKDESIGWMFMATYSPDGKKLAAYWNRRPTPGLWIVSLEDRSERFMGAEGEIYPLDWSPDGQWVYGQKGEDYLMIKTEGRRIEPLPTIPFTIDGETHYMPLDGKTRIIVNRKSQSDVWIIENFDQFIR